ncbi:hypothetical protein [Reichenbachiella versicolor]|uniref:hypothetical protein n=1 Tax=Reichenbachiella versicolor TaxID=1821036 RepID=UPI000D6E93FD|nr:hypothetical protein [Reichenbachiella versicolor]
MSKKEILSMFFLLILSTSVFAQLRIDKAVPPPFDAAAIIKYCDHPVGIEYGIPDIKYSMQTLKDRDLEIPIQLSYHPLGIRVEEEASWVGLGWYLQAGGFITRIVRGENDFGLFDFPDQNKAKGYPFEHIKPCFDDCEENENDDFHAGVCEGKIDSDPDIFFFDVLGMKGKFLLTPDHDSDKEYIDVELISPKNMTAKYFLRSNRWQIEDQEGYVYDFSTRSTTYCLNNYFDYKHNSHKLKFDVQESNSTSTWHLDKVTSPSGVVAEFEYATDFKSDGTFQKMNINDEDVWDVHYSSYCFPEEVENVQIISQSQYKDVYLKSINIGEYTANFIFSEQDHIKPKLGMMSKSNRLFSDLGDGKARQKLDAIIINQNGDRVQKASFSYSYFWNYDEEILPSVYSRLELDKLVLNTNGVQQTNEFFYKDKFGIIPKESHARDIWGFYNGEEDLYNITPSDYFNYSQPEKLLQHENRSKHYSLDHITEAVLQSIKYGDGRVVTYTFDHQEFYHIDQEISDHFEQKVAESNREDHELTPFLFGGLRVKEVKEEFDGQTKLTKYDYTVDGKEDGKLIISQYSHAHNGYGHKTSGNHCVKYENVNVETISAPLN